MDSLQLSPAHSKSTRKSSRHRDGSPDRRSHSSHHRPRSSRHRSERSRSRRRDRSPSPKAYARKKCWTCGATPLPDKLVCKDCFRDYAANHELKSQQVVDLLKRTMKYSFSELAALVPAQSVPQTSQVQETEPNVRSPSGGQYPSASIRPAG